MTTFDALLQLLMVTLLSLPLIRCIVDNYDDKNDDVAAFKNEIFFNERIAEEVPPPKRTKLATTTELRSRCEILKLNLLLNSSVLSDSNLIKWFSSIVTIDDNVISYTKKKADLDDSFRSILISVLEMTFTSDMMLAPSRYWPYIADVYATCVNAIRHWNIPDDVLLKIISSTFREFEKDNRVRVGKILLRSIWHENLT